MNESLDITLKEIGKDYESIISPSSRFYLEVDIGQKAEQLGFSKMGKKYKKVLAVVPVKQAQRGMKVRIDGRTFVNYGQLDSGVAIPGHVIKKSNLVYENYVPWDSMILNFA